MSPRRKPRQKHSGVSEMPRSLVELTAQIIGPISAAAAALRKAKEIGGPVAFLNTGDSILVIPMGDSAI